MESTVQQTELCPPEPGNQHGLAAAAKLAPWVACGRKIRACVRPVVSCPRRSCTRGGPVAYPSFPPSSCTSSQSSPRAIGTNANTTQRNATQPSAAQRDPTTQPPHLIPTRPDPAQAVLSHPNPKLARLVPSDKKRQRPVFRPHSPGRLEPPGDPEIQLRTGPAPIQPPASRLQTPGARPPHLVSTYLPCLQPRLSSRSRPDGRLLCPRLTGPCLARLIRTCPPAPPRFCHPHPDKARHPPYPALSCPALPCPASHFCTLYAAPRRATCLPAHLSRAPRYTPSHSPTVHGQPPRGCPCPAHSCPLLPSLDPSSCPPVSPPPTFRSSSLHTACMTWPSLP